jgi:hypothetical protein
MFSIILYRALVRGGAERDLVPLLSFGIWGIREERREINNLLLLASEIKILLCSGCGWVIIGWA